MSIRKTMVCNRCHYEIQEYPKSIPTCLRNKLEIVTTGVKFPRLKTVVWNKWDYGGLEDRPLCFSRKRDE